MMELHIKYCSAIFYRIGMQKQKDITIKIENTKKKKIYSKTHLYNKKLLMPTW